MPELVDNGTNKKCIKVFDKIFFIESTPKMKGTKLIGWDVTVTYRSGLKDTPDITETYTDYVEDRLTAEEACLGYLLIEHCRGGIYWKESNFPKK